MILLMLLLRNTTQLLIVKSNISQRQSPSLTALSLAGAIRLAISGHREDRSASPKELCTH